MTLIIKVSSFFYFFSFFIIKINIINEADIQRTILWVTAAMGFAGLIIPLKGIIIHHYH
jgi:hypothetical protein